LHISTPSANNKDRRQKLINDMEMEEDTFEMEKENIRPGHVYI
jgi:hypothetical protein